MKTELWPSIFLFCHVTYDTTTKPVIIRVFIACNECKHWWNWKIWQLIHFFIFVVDPSPGCGSCTRSPELLILCTWPKQIMSELLLDYLTLYLPGGSWCNPPRFFGPDTVIIKPILFKFCIPSQKYWDKCPFNHF